ncbi:MAG: hypothetical protein GY884_23620 [Proteobacteria bacterium]|nr:hypothetical protein [Pseudomonadota bacterium]
MRPQYAVPLADEVFDVLGQSRLRQLLVGGMSVVQIVERLPGPIRVQIEVGETPILARRQAIREVTLALDDLVQAGTVVRSRMKMKTTIVDVYRRRLRRPR